MKNNDTIALSKIIKYCEDIDVLMKQYGSDVEKYKTDISFQYSCNMCIIQIGELVARLSDELMDANRQIPWRAIKGMRNLHAHDYENVDLDIVWHTLVSDIPELKEQIHAIIGTKKKRVLHQSS